MKKTVFLPILVIILTAAILLGASWALNSVAETNAQKAHIEMMKLILPDSENFVAEPYTGDDANIRSVHKAENGYVIETVTYGYAGEIAMLVAVNNDGKIVGLVVTDMSETFGLGANALNDHEFLAQFLNSSGGFAVVTVGEDTFSGATADGSSGATGAASADTDVSVYVDGISGATVTSKAVVRCVNSAAAYVTGADAGSSATTWGG